MYYSLPEVWLRKCFPKSISVSTDRLSENSNFEKSVEEIKEIDPGSTYIFCQNMMDRYIDRTNIYLKNEIYSLVDQFVLLYL